MTARSRTIWTFVVTSVALFMAQLDNLVVTTALPAIRQHLHASLSSLEWTVNAYTLTFAVLLLTGATLGERFGRRRMLVIGLAVFTVGSAAAALAPSADWLVASRALQGAGAAIVTPLTLTLLSAAVPGRAPRHGARHLGRGRRPRHRDRPARRRRRRAGLVLAVDLLAQRAARPRADPDRAAARSPRATAPRPASTCPASSSPAPACSASCSAWSAATRSAGPRPTSLTALVSGVALVAAFVAWEQRTPSRCCRCGCSASRGFSATNARQRADVLRHVRLDLPARAVPADRAALLAAAGRPADAAVDRHADRRRRRSPACSPTASAADLSCSTGLVLQADRPRLARRVSAADRRRTATLVPAFIVSGIGMALFFAPVADARARHGPPAAKKASPPAPPTPLRELGGVFGVAVLASVFAAHGSYLSPAAFAEGMRAAVLVGAIAVAVAAFALLGVPRRSAVPVQLPTDIDVHAAELVAAAA